MLVKWKSSFYEPLSSYWLLQIFSVDALQCYYCYHDTSRNSTSCQKPTTQNCTTDLKFCVTQISERKDGSKEFTRRCVPPEVCQPDYCEEHVIKAIGRKSCNITCCQENFCNRDDYVPPVSKGHVPRVYWLLGYSCVIGVTWVSLFGGRLWRWRKSLFCGEERGSFHCGPKQNPYWLALRAEKTQDSQEKQNTPKHTVLYRLRAVSLLLWNPTGLHRSPLVDRARFIRVRSSGITQQKRDRSQSTCYKKCITVYEDQLSKGNLNKILFLYIW